MQRQYLVLAALLLLLGVGLWYYGTQPVATPAPYPTLLPANQVLVEDTSASSTAPAGFHTLRDTQLDLTFNAPLNWKAQVLPEGDGRPSIVSPDIADPLGSMTGAYLHYSFAPLPDQFKGHPEQFMALLKEGSIWTETSLDGHPAFISKGSDGYTAVVAQLGDNSFVMIGFADPGNTYAAVLDEFLKSFHTL